MPKILRLFIDDDVADQNIRKKAFKIISKEKFESLIQFLEGSQLDEKLFQWKHYDEKQGEITKNLRPLFLSLDFHCDHCHSVLNSAIKLLKSTFNQKNH